MKYTAFISISIFTIAALTGCGGKDPKLAVATAKVEEAIKAHFSKYEEDTYTTLIRRYMLKDMLIQVKGITIEAESSNLTEADRINEVTWKGICTLNYSVARRCVMNLNDIKWDEWKDQSSEDLPSRIWIEEKDGKMVIAGSNLYMAGEDFTLESCVKDDDSNAFIEMIK